MLILDPSYVMGGGIKEKDRMLHVPFHMFVNSYSLSVSISLAQKQFFIFYNKPMPICLVQAK